MSVPVLHGGVRSALIHSLQKLTFFERASAHILAGLLPRIRVLSIKLAAAHHFHEGMFQACRLRDLLIMLGHRARGLLWTSQTHLRLMRSLDGDQSAERLLSVLYFGVKVQLAAEYERLLSHTDPLLDVSLIEAIHSYLPKLVAQREWADGALARHRDRTDVALRVAEVLRSWRSDADEPRLPLDEAIWPPVRRAPAALRLKGAKRGDNGALPIHSRDSLRDRRGIGIFLHNSINEEYTTLELMGRNSYEHPDMPWAFHLSMARQVSDEARHARVLERLAAKFGVRYGQYPIYVTNYDMLYSFRPCRPGSKRELLWRLLLRSTYQEALALDSLAFEVSRRRFLRQADMAKAFRYILSDELFHVENGLRWSRIISEKYSFDTLKERNEARDFYLAREIHERLRFVIKHPERVAVEVADRSEGPRSLPFGIEFAAELRRRAGFSEAEIEQARSWVTYA